MPFDLTFPVKMSYQYEDRFAIANFFFEEPFVTKVTTDAKISAIGKLVSIKLLVLHKRCGVS